MDISNNYTFPTQGVAIDFSATSNPTGLSGITFNQCFYKKIAPKLSHVVCSIAGVSTATTFTLTLPFICAYAEVFPVRVMDGGTYLSTGIAITAAGSATLTMFTTPATGAFIASGNKRLNTFNAVLDEQ